MPEETPLTEEPHGGNRAEDVAPPWPPLVLGAASIVFAAGFSALWGGVMACLNRRRLDSRRVAWWPLVIGVLALGTSVATSVISQAPWWMSPYSRIVWLVRLGLWDFWIWWIGPAAEVAGCILILLTAYLPQQRIYREVRKSGGRRSGVAVPILTGFALAILSISLDGFSQQRFFSEMAETAYREGLEQLADGRRDEALKEFDRAIQIASDHADARIQRARLRASSGKDEEALDDYAHALKVRPDDLDLRMERAALAVASRKDQQAIEDTDRILKEHPDDALALYTRAVAHEHQQKFSVALDDLNVAVKAAPKSALIHFERGRVRLRLNRIDEAIEDLTKAIDLSPKDPIYHYSRAAAYLQKQELQLAVEDFSEAIANAGTRLDFYWARANTYLELGEVGKAIADCDTALELIEQYGKSDPGALLAESRTLSLRARCYVRLNELEKAKDDAGRAIKLDPKWADGWLARGLTKLAQQDAEAAENDFTQAIDLAGAADRGIRARALYYRGLSRKDQGKTEQGQADQEEALKLHPEVTRAPALPGESAPEKE